MGDRTDAGLGLASMALGRGAEASEELGRAAAAAIAVLGEELARRGFDPVGSGAAEFRAFIAEEDARCGEVAQRAGITPG